MINHNENTFIVINDEGKEVICDILFTFDNAETEKSYIVYTDNSRDEEDGNIQVFASVYAENDDGSKCLLPIETEKEWRVIEILLKEIQESIKEKDN